MRIAQISDIHLKADGALAYDAADTETALKQTIRHVNHMIPLPDVVLVTGDISDDGSRDSYRIGAELFSHLSVPFYLIPGNHDQKDNLMDAFPGHSYLAERIRGTRATYMCFAVDGYPVRLIGLDTVTPGMHGGGLGPARLEWLHETLAEKPDAPMVIFMHHPPFASGIGHMDLEVFSGRKPFEDLISRHRQVHRIACGHIHRFISCRFGGTVATVCPGVGMQVALDLRAEAPSGFRLEPAGVMIHYLNRSWSEVPVMVTHTSIVEDFHGQYGDFHPFFDVVNPKEA